MAPYSPRAVHLFDDSHSLKDVPDPKKVAPDGQTIEGRMRKLCVDVAEDIKRCANTCDTYLKFALLVCFLPPPPLTTEQEEDARENTRRVHMGRQTFEVR